MQKIITLLIVLLVTLGVQAQNVSLDLDFSNPADAERFNPILDTGGEFTKTVSNGEMKVVINKKEWHFLQVWINPFDFINNPFVSFRMKADQATPVRIWLKQGSGPELTIYNQVLEPSANYQTIAFTIENLAPLTGDVQEMGIELGGFQLPPATFAGTVYFDHFKLGQAAMPNSSLNLDFSDAAHADRLNFIFDTGGELTKTVTDGELKLVLNKKEWHFFQVLVSPLNFIKYPYFTLKLKVDQSTPIRIWITQQGTTIQKNLFNEVVEPSADYQTIQLAFDDVSPITGYVQELNLDIGGYQVPPAQFSGTVYFDEIKFGEAAKPATEVFGTGYAENFSGDLYQGWAAGEGYQISRDGDALKFTVNRTTPIPEGEMNKLPSLSFEGKVLNVNENPYLNLDIKGTDPFVLSVIAVDNSNVRKERRIRVVPTDAFQTVSFNLGAIEGLDVSEIERFYFDFNRTGFAFNSTVRVDEISIGDQAQNLAVMDAIADKKYFKNSGAKEILLTNIANASSVSVTASSSLIENANITSITNGIAKLQFTVKANAVGQEAMSLTVNGAEGYSNNAYTFNLTIEDNLPPTLNAVADAEAEARKNLDIELNGISDGNSTVEQPLEFSVTSSDPKIVTGKVEYEGEGNKAKLILKSSKKGKVTVSVTAKDDGGGADSTTQSFALQLFNNINDAPTIDAVEDVEVYEDAGPSALLLAGITDGNNGKEKIKFIISNSNPLIVSDVSVSYDKGNEATLYYTPVADTTGTSTITLTLIDNGGNGSNNGNDSTTVSFNVTVLKRPVTGYIASLKKAVEGFSGNDKLQVTEVDSSDFKALVFNASDKFYWDGVSMQLPEELDLSENSYLTMEVFPLEQNTEHWIWFYDANGIRNDLNNRTGDHIQKAVAGQWNKLIFDFSGENDWVNNELNADINNKRITRILFDMHNAAFTWPPPPNYTGTFVVRNIRIGSAADIDITPVATINPVADQVAFINKVAQKVKVSGITNGNGNAAGISLILNNSNHSAVVNPMLSAINEAGEAILTYNTGTLTGASTISIQVNAEGSTPAEISFDINVLDQSSTSAAVVSVDVSKRFQQMYGFGTFSINSANIEYYTKEMGGSAMRVGLIENQFEPMNDNDDPNVLNMEAFNYNAFDWNALRDLKEKGVQNFILTSWSPPAWMKTNLSLDHLQAGYTKDTDGTTNRLDYTMYEEFAESMVAVVKAFEQRAGIDLLGIGLQNEPAFHEPYPSAILGPDRFVELIKVVGRRFEQEGINTKLYMAEQVSNFVDDNNQYLNAVQADPEANQYTDIFAIHGYGSNGITPGQPNFSEWQGYWQNASEGEYPKEMWMTETHKDYASWLDALQIAGAIYGALEHGNVSLWTQWGFEGPFVTQGKPTSMLYAMSNFAKFIRPGYTRVETTSGNEDILATSFVDETSGKTAIVLINKGDLPLSVKIEGADPGTSWDMYNTADNRNLEKVTTFENGVFLLPGRSVTTVVGSTTSAEGSMAGTAAKEVDLNEADKRAISVYPNPNNGLFYFDTEAQIDRVEIVDLTGQVRYKGNIKAGESNVSVNGLRPGLYIINLYSKKGNKKERIVID